MSDERTEINTFASHLKMIRSLLNLKQDQLAERLGVSRQTISAIEKGTMELSKPLFLAMLALFMAAATTNPIIRTLLGTIGAKTLFDKYLGFHNNDK